MQPPGIQAFEARTEERTGIYAFESPQVELPHALLVHFQGQAEAWGHFQTQPPSYRQASLHWVVSAKREETQLRRLQKLIEVSAAGRRLGMLSPGKS